LAETNSEGALLVADRIKEAIDSLRVDYENKKICNT